MSIFYFIFGVIIGFGLALITFVAASFDNNGEHLVNNLRSIATTNEKGSIIFPKTDEMEAMEQMFELNDKHGLDTNIGEIEINEMR